MKKGWNLEYFSEKIKQLNNLSEQEKNEERKQDYNDLSEMYSYLYTVLFFADGDVDYIEDNAENFLREMNGVKNPYVYELSLNRKVNELSKQIMKLDPISCEFTYQDKISYRESTDLIYEFLKEHFDESYAKIFKKYFVNKKEFVLLDESDAKASVTVVEDDMYILLPKTKNIDLISSMAHEAGHIKRIIQNDVFNNHCLFNEFESFTYEVRFLIWLIQNDIHSHDAVKYLLNLFKELESGIVVRYFNNKHKLTYMNNVENFNKKCESLNIYQMCGINKKSKLFDILYETLEENFLMYFLSFIAVTNELINKDYKEKYEQVIKNVGQNDGIILARDNNLNFTDLSIYKTLRREMINKI